METVVVRIEVCGEPILGVWCDRCMLPAGWRVACLIDGHPSVWGGCVECG